MSEFAVTLKTGDQRPVGVQRGDDGTVQLHAGGDAAATFRLSMTEPDRVMLRIGEESDSEAFQVVPGSDPQTFGFRSLATGRMLSVGETEVFTFEPAPVEDVEAHRSCCCGPSPRKADGPGVLWNEVTHFRTVELAIHLLGNMQNPTDEAVFIHALWQLGAAQHIREGLKGADEWWDWMPVFPPYYFHFFNHEDDRSYPPQWLFPGHAVSKGAETFDSSVRRFRTETDKKQALIELGLSLHFLTDLCQPMHAANFINNPILGSTGDYRHAGYEDYAEDYVVNRNFFRQPNGYPPLQRSEIEDVTPTPGAWLHGVSVQSLKTWKDVLKPEADKKMIIRQGPNGPIIIYIRTWGSEADASLMRSLWLAPRNTARYLCMWANRVR